MVFVGDPELHAYERPDPTPLQLSGPLMGRCEVLDDWRRVNTSDAGPTLHSPDTVSQNGLLVILVCDVNERNHECLSAEHL